jgi:hypothetical protein
MTHNVKERPMSLHVLVQAGHMLPLEPHIPGLGAPGEQALNQRLRDALVKLLRDDDRFKVTPAPGNLPDGIHVDAALFLHCDGATPAAARGFSFGFPPGGRHKELAHHIRAEFLKLPAGHPPGDRADNGTKDASEYYGYSPRTISNSMCLIEHGFVTNPTEHAWMKAHVGDFARAEYVGLCRHFAITPHGDAEDDDTPVLIKDMVPNREAVTHLQKLLRGAHVADTPLNGKYDVETRTAVKRFQRKHHIPTDDRATVDDRTWQALAEVNHPH